MISTYLYLFLLFLKFFHFTGIFSLLVYDILQNGFLVVEVSIGPEWMKDETIEYNLHKVSVNRSVKKQNKILVYRYVTQQATLAV